jgi:hypothetical protein
MPGWWQKSRAWFDRLLERYGPPLLVVYFTLFFGTWFAFWLAFSIGRRAGGHGGRAGLVGAAWIATKVTQPIRIADHGGAHSPSWRRVWRRVRGRAQRPPQPAPPSTEPPSPG